MQSLANLECFVRSAELGSFSEAARRMSLSPAAVSRSVAVLERSLGVRLFHRSTRSLTLTEAGETFRLAIAGPLEGVQDAIAGITRARNEPAGLLKLSMPPTLGLTTILPMLPDFLARYPLVKPEWHFESRPVDLVAEGYDAAIGGGFELSPGFVARPLAPAHIIAVASPGFVAGRPQPRDPGDLQEWDGIVVRSIATGRIRHWTLRDAGGREMPGLLRETIIVNDPAASREAALLGLGVAMLAVPDVLPALDDGRLVRLLPHWYADAGAISLYYASRRLLPAKTRAFVDWLQASFKAQRLAERFAGSLGRA
jgi:DNA-binding transcriptional LysR family regulator